MPAGHRLRREINKEMARQTTVRLTDDLDGSDAQTTVRFSWDGIAYEIDLTTEHAAAFAAAVRPYLEAARRVGPARSRSRGTSTGRGARSGRAVGEQAVIREWARSNGFQLADRGGIPRRVLDAYQGAPQQVSSSTSSDPAPTETRTKTGAAPARKATGRKRAAATAAKAAPAAKKTAAKKTAAKKVSARKTAAKKTAAKKATRRPRAAVS